MQVLTGIDEDTIEWKRLNQIFEEKVFELHDGPVKQECFAVYMMTDAVESIVVFENAVVTGEYESDNENPVTGSITKLEDSYMLVARQGNDNAFTIRFNGLRCEEKLYQYHNIGHFWMKDYEMLRNINYQIGLIYEKYTFMGEAYCTAKEKALLPYYAFAPLRRFVCVYWEEDEKFVSTEAGIQIMFDVAEEVGDEKMQKVLRRYLLLTQKSYNNTLLNCIKKNKIEKRLSRMLTLTKHKLVVDQIQKKIDQASSGYATPSFGQQKDETIYKCRMALKKKFPDSTILEERSFCLGEEFKYVFHVIEYETEKGRTTWKRKSYVIEGDDYKETVNMIMSLAKTANDYVK